MRAYTVLCAIFVSVGSYLFGEFIIFFVKFCDILTAVRIWAGYDSGVYALLPFCTMTNADIKS